MRIREDILIDRLRARHRLSKFLLRQGRLYQETKAWSVRHRRWLYAQHFDLAPLEQTCTAYLRALEETEARLTTVTQQIKDVDTLSAFTLVAETQEFGRFPHAPAYMSATGLVCAEYSSGTRQHRGSITKTGSAHLRRVLVEAAWSYRGRNGASVVLTKRRQGCPAAVVQIAQRAQDRLHRKFWRLMSRGKASQVAVVAVARELAGFVWAIAQHVPMPAVS